MEQATQCLRVLYNDMTILGYTEKRDRSFYTLYLW